MGLYAVAAIAIGARVKPVRRRPSLERAGFMHHIQAAEPSMSSTA
jgi:hypothetical protein